MSAPRTKPHPRRTFEEFGTHYHECETPNCRNNIKRWYSRWPALRRCFECAHRKHTTGTYLKLEAL